MPDLYFLVSEYRTSYGRKLWAMEMKIKAAVEKVPRGMMIAPLVIGATITTLTPRAAVPMLVAAANPSYAPAATSATILVAASVAVSSQQVPPLTAYWRARVESCTPEAELGAVN
jgi:hypothetical protein